VPPTAPRVESGRLSSSLKQWSVSRSVEADISSTDLAHEVLDPLVGEVRASRMLGIRPQRAVECVSRLAYGPGRSRRSSGFASNARGEEASPRSMS